MKIFVSAPSADLKDVRKNICEMLDSKDITAFSMEDSLYASDNPPWNQLAEKINQVDYLLLVLGDEYGKKNEEGIGYTEKEVNYAEQNNKPILAFIKDTEENNAENNIDLIKLKERISNDKKRTVAFWNKTDEIYVLVTKAIEKIRKENKNFIETVSLNDSIVDKRNRFFELVKFFPDYPMYPVGSCGFIFGDKHFGEATISIEHPEIMDIFKILESKGTLVSVKCNDGKKKCQISSIRLDLNDNEKNELEKDLMEYKEEYLDKLQNIVRFLQIDDFESSQKRKFAYKVIRIKYEFWEWLIKFSMEHDYMKDDGIWDMFSYNPSALNVIHSITCDERKYDGIMHAYFNIESDEKVNSKFVWLVLNMEMTKDDKSNIQNYSKRKIWGCKTAYDWCVDEFFPKVCKTYGLKKDDMYEEKQNENNNNIRIKISELQSFILENRMKLSQKEIENMKNALKYCLSTQLLPIDEYGYIISKLGLRQEYFNTKNSRSLSEQIIFKMESKWKEEDIKVDADHLLRCINIFTEGYSKTGLSDDEVANVYVFLKYSIERMEKIKFIEKYRNFYV